MDDEKYTKTVKAAVKPAFGRKKSIPSKYVPLYPKNSERELKSVVNQYFEILKKEMNYQFPNIKRVYKKAQDDDFDEFGFAYLMHELSNIFGEAERKTDKRFKNYGLQKRIKKIAGRTKSTSYAEWKKCVEKTVGVTLIDYYYNVDFYSDLLNSWVDQSVSLIQSIPQRELGAMRDIILDGFQNHLSANDIADKIQKEYNVSRSKALFLARDQIGTLNAELTRRQHEDAGVSCYRWIDSGDSTVRECHHSFNGRVFRWDSPPEIWTRRSGIIVYTGRHCHPGQDYGCRCRAEPVFDYDTLNLPIQGTIKEGGRI